MEKKSEKQIAEDIATEVLLTMKRIEKAHNEVAHETQLKSDAYSRMKDDGMWDERKIIEEYLRIKEKKSILPAAIRQLCVAIFETASTNYWAKQIREEQCAQNAGKELSKKPKKRKLQVQKA